ncbi:MAG: formate/nitrite transporter family protein [Candidatus Caenarcaniphilales bacterium]|nr:formate/nitrite transporter family protein [Candidatus Caenarcaniphilales bacterium]
MKNKNQKTVIEDEIVTERTIERFTEDKKYTPVIIKRTDESVRHPGDILETAIKEGKSQIDRHKLSLFLSAIAAGLILGFSAMAVGIVTQYNGSIDSSLLSRFLVALVYPLGFILCIMSGSQLFTEHTATAVYPYLDKQTSFTSLLKLWSLVILGNLIGCIVSSTLLSASNEIIDAKLGYFSIADHLIHQSSTSLVVSAILAGWLMALGGWLVLATPPTSSQIMCVYIVTFLIGFGQLHHSIAGTVEMLTAVFLGASITTIQVVKFIGLALMGNLIGGSVFVAALNYAHIKKTQDLKS